jgi:membrane associated rhomboid family serine protease
MNRPALGRLSATNALIIINVLVYLWLCIAHIGHYSFITGYLDDETLVSTGALIGALALQGEWWRIISSGFLHSGIAHIGLNMFALYQVGTFLEIILGARRMLTIYFVSLIGSGLAVVWFSPDQATVGASGAIFGLFGALVAVGIRLGQRGRGLIMQAVPIILLNLAFTFAVPIISRAGHVGGLITGFLIALLIVAMAPRTRDEGEPVATVAGTEEEDAHDPEVMHGEP